MNNHIDFHSLSPLYTFEIGNYLTRWVDLKPVLDEYNLSYSLENIARVILMSIEIKLCDNSNLMPQP